MNAQARLLFAMIMLIVVPAAVTGAAAIGLLRMSQRLDAVAEEFAEVMALEPVDADFRVGLLALSQPGADFEELARDSFTKAHTTLSAYQASQLLSVAADQHQASESSHSSALGRRIETLLSTFDEPGGASPQERLALAQSLHADLLSLYADAEQGVHAAEVSARSTRKTTLATVLTASVLAALLCLTLSYWTVRGVSHRLRELRSALSLRADGALLDPRRDVGGVMHDIEALNERLLLHAEEQGRELLRRERLAGVGLLAADVAHEINNPMNAMLGLSELALRTMEPGALSEDNHRETVESLRIIRREALRCKSIVGRLMAMVRSNHAPTWFDASRLLQEAASVAAAARPDRASCIRLGQDPLPLPVLAPQEDVKQIMLTLLINAADAVNADGRIDVDAVRTDEEVRLRVRDDGRGFSAQQERELFTPFRTTKSTEGGAGLGLAIAQTLAADIGAEIRAYSDGAGRGSVFVLAIPALEEAP